MNEQYRGAFDDFCAGAWDSRYDNAVGFDCFVAGALLSHRHIELLQSLCLRAADALEYGAVGEFLDKHLIAELRETSKSICG